MNQLATDSPSTSRGVLSDAELRDIDAYWRACNYLALKPEGTCVGAPAWE
jgi:phosphoketolase